MFYLNVNDFTHQSQAKEQNHPGHTHDSTLSDTSPLTVAQTMHSFVFVKAQKHFEENSHSMSVFTTQVEGHYKIVILIINLIAVISLSTVCTVASVR